MATAPENTGGNLPLAYQMYLLTVFLQPSSFAKIFVKSLCATENVTELPMYLTTKQDRGLERDL
jgi:hypothetical protein